MLVPTRSRNLPRTKNEERVQRDRVLSERIRRGDRAAFEILYKEYAAPLCRFTYGYAGSHEAAEDLVQDVFLWLWEHRTRWYVVGTVSAYLYRAARNRALDYRRHVNVVASLQWRLVFEAEEDRVSDPVELVVRREAVDRVQNSVNSLPVRCREVFVLSRWHGLTYREVAQALGLAPKTVETQMTRAFRKLRTNLTPYYA